MGIGLWTVCFFLFSKKGLFEWLYLLRGPILDVWEVSCQFLVNATTLPLQKFLEEFADFDVQVNTPISFVNPAIFFHRGNREPDGKLTAMCTPEVLTTRP